MKIAWIRIKGYQQFEDTFLDFRDPKTGKALDKICLIGRNGTGKSTIIDLLNRFIISGFHAIQQYMIGPYFAFKIEYGDTYCIVFCTRKKDGSDETQFFNDKIELIPDWFEKLIETTKDHSLSAIQTDLFFGNPNLRLENNSNDLLTVCPAESISNLLLDIINVPPTSLNEALALFKQFPYYNIVSNQTVTQYWKLLIYLIKKRESDQNEFENNPLNITKTKIQLLDEFNAKNPNILKVIADLWNEILDKAGLRFDYEHAKIPVQLSENLEGYIVTKANKRVPYSQLSTGIRNFIFRFGHIKTLYFNREIKRGILLVDEPENSLFPDFLLNIIEQYEKVTTDKNGERNTQMFFATHSPIMASQFSPDERIILEWDNNGSVKASKGIAPEGDDPNDILYQDFGMTEIVSRKGQEVWKTYLELKKQLTRETDENKKKEIVEKVLELGRTYKFD